MEEFGVSSDFASDANAATYYRHVLHGTLLAGATGWIAWNNTDFALPGQRPVPPPRLRAELRAHRRPRQRRSRRSGKCRSFARTLETIDHTRTGRADTDTALIVSSYLDTQYPFTSPDTHAGRRQVAAPGIRRRPAGRPAAQAHQGDNGIEDGARLYLAPSVKQFLAPTAARLEELASSDGATVYVSYCAGDVSLAPRPLLREHERAVRRSGTSSTSGSATRSRTTPCGSPSPATSAASPGAPPSTSRRRAASTAAPTCPSRPTTRRGHRHRRPRPPRAAEASGRPRAR